MIIHLIWIILADYLPFAQSYTSSLCFRQNNHASKICNAKSDALICNRRDVIMINTIRYNRSTRSIHPLEMGPCKICQKNGFMSAWEIDATRFRNRLYQLCSQKNNCSFDKEIEIPSPDGKGKRYVWKAIISYDCVSSGLINDICSPWVATIREANSTIYLSLQGYSGIRQHSTCIIKGDIRRTNITVIDYRPYYNDSMRANNSVFVNSKRLLPCLNTSQTDQVLYNMPVKVTGYRTNITVSKHDVLPDMLWISVNGLGVTIQCNTGDKDSTPNTNSLTPVRPSGTTSKEGLETTGKLSLSGSSEVFPSPIIGGTSVGLVALVAVILTVYLLHRRRSRRMPEPRDKEAIYYNETHFEAEQPEETRSDGGTNRAREDGDELYVNMSNSSPEDQERNNVYLNMVHQALNEADAEHTEETISNIQNRNENKLYDIEEPYYKNLTRADESESNYCKLNKIDEDTHEYNSLTGIDNC